MKDNIKILTECGNVSDDKVQINLNGLYLPIGVMMYKNFDTREPLGFTHPELIDGKLYINIYKEIIEDWVNYYPAIGFSIKESFMKNEIMHVHRSILISIGLCDKPNVDESIKSIGEQIHGIPKK